MLREAHRDLFGLVAKSIWRVCGKPGPFYCSMKFRDHHLIGWRLDRTCMVPVNSAGHQIDELVGPALVGVHGIGINWSEDMVLVLDNWAILHARGPAPDSEAERVIERIYVR